MRIKELIKLLVIRMEQTGPDATVYFQDRKEGTVFKVKKAHIGLDLDKVYLSEID